MRFLRLRIAIEFAQSYSIYVKLKLLFKVYVYVCEKSFNFFTNLISPLVPCY